MVKFDKPFGANFPEAGCIEFWWIPAYNENTSTGLFKMDDEVSKSFLKSFSKLTLTSALAKRIMTLLEGIIHSLNGSLFEKQRASMKELQRVDSMGVCPYRPKRYFLSVLELNQFRNKIKTHGLICTLLYSLEFAVRPFWRKYWVNGVRKSYSQDYEDVIIDKVLGNKSIGTYLDIGAFDPTDLNNTKRFYDRGWRGCNIEPEPSQFKKFVRERPDDINLNLGISDCIGKLDFFDFEDAAYSTFSRERAEELIAMGSKLKKKIELPVISMKDIFEKHFQGRAIDFCSLDTEGMDLRILKSNDWSRFRPKVLCVELTLNKSVGEFLAAVGYRKITETFEYGNPLNAIYISEK